MLNRRTTAVVALALCLALISDSAQSQRRSRTNNQDKAQQSQQPATSDQRGTDQVPLTVKILSGPDAKEKSDKEERERQDKAKIDERTAFETQRIADYTDRLALFTGFLICVAILQAGFFWWQLKEMKQASVVATQAAGAAALNAMAVISAERAYVKMSHSTPGLQIYQGSGVFDITIGIKNYGNTPAKITDIFIKPSFIPQDQFLPSTPDYSFNGERTIPRAFLVKQEEFFLHANRFTLSVPAGDVDSGIIKLYMLGYVDYIHQFGTRHRAGYARCYEPALAATNNNLIFVTEDGYNYDRPRSKDEGYDWNEAQRASQ